MESWKRKRTQYRREFTCLAEKVQKAVAVSDETAGLTFELLSEAASNLFEAEATVRDLWCVDENFDEASYQADQDKAMSYKLRWHEIRSLFPKIIPHASSASCHSAESSLKQTSRKHQLPKLPKLELAKFDGNVKSWLLFWGQFKKIHEDEHMDSSDKFQYLLQSMTPNSSARQLVESYPPCAANYEKAVESLKSRFARDDVLIETYVRGLLSLMQQKGETKDLSVLYDNLQTHLQALETLGVAKDKYASMLFPMIESALPESVLRAWHRSQPNTRDLTELMKFLRQEVESEERIQLARRELDDVTLVEPKQPTACFITEAKREKESSGKQGALSCIWCSKDNHSAVECYTAAKMTLKERVEYIKGKKACLICLKGNHFAKKCKSFPKCLFCKKRHYTIMCTEMAAGQDSSKQSEPETSSNLSCQQKSTKTTLLQTLAVKLVHGKKEVCIRAMIDSGAQRSYIKKDLVQKFGMKPTSKEVISHCLFGGFETKKEECQVFDIRVKNIENHFSMNLSVIEQTNICSFLPKLRSHVILEQLRKSGIRFYDSTDSPDDVSLLIGADYSGLLLTGSILQLENNMTAIETKLGWTIQGSITGVYSSITNSTTTLHCLNKIDLTDLWTLEAIGINDPAVQASKATHDQEILKTFEDNIKVNEEGRYEVSLPWRDVPRPQTNYDIAKKRMESTMNRLKQLGKLNDYDNVFREWLQLGIIEEAPDQSVHGHYMPHHAVIKESSLTTKIRPVFDASAKDRNGISLNSCLEKGVNLLERIPNLLINFRKYKIGVTADITKAFLQISLAPDDRDYLRFLWWSKIDEEEIKMVTYRHRRVVFGVTSSPFHLIATINHHLDNCSEQYKETAMKLKKSFYVDNCVTSLETQEDLEKFMTESKQVMRQGMFDLRGWIASPVFVEETVESTSILGIMWNVKEDTLRCNVNLNNIDFKLTKRTLLSVAQRVFDPIGVTCATTIVPKMIMQKSWSRRLTWDQELPKDLAKEFKRWLDQAHVINDCIIPRRLTSMPFKECENSLHVFCDSSKDAYSACMFLRSKHGENVDVSLVLAKSRVTPVDKITIPRLELIAATLASRLSITAIKSLALPNCAVYYWTDSSVVLTWIKSDGPWSVFVSNRVKEIKGLSPASAWRHVPGHLNPADLPSRGIDPKGLLESRWWEGPAWLRMDEVIWPVADVVLNSSEVDSERKKTGILTMLVEEETFLDRLTYFSSYTKIVRMLCWMLRFKKKPVTKELTYDEFEYAEKVLIRLIQQKYKDSVSNQNIQTFIDDKNIIRLNTKLTLGSEDYDFKFPIILPGADTIVRRLVERRHVELKHAGAQTLLNSLRQTFWIIGVRKLVRNIIHRCIRCKRFKAKRCQAPTGVLPKERMEAAAAFQFSGVDLAGPLMLRSGGKAWIVLFTCATYRAVHLEVVESLSTGEFLMALRRFVARRGRVEQLFSDNATNFRGLDNAFSSLDWDEIQRFSSITRIKWNFLPPAAPWWGGFYERLIGFLKQILRRVLGKASISLIELQTVLCDCETVINSRPLTYSGGHKELQPLTPSMFVQPLTSHHSADFDEVDNKTLNLRHRYCQKLRDDLRKRFRNEYISLLTQKREKINLSHEPLQKGDIVLMETDGKRVTWPLAVVEGVCTGADGVARVVQIRTSTGKKKVVLGYDSAYNGELFETTLAILGVPPQHNAPNRDDHITVKYDYIMPDKKHLFDVLSNDEWLFHELSYDFQSAGHYGSHKYSIGGYATIEPKRKINEGFGDSQGFSFMDIWKIRMMYNYISKSRSKIIKKSDCLKMFKPGPNFHVFQPTDLGQRPRPKPNKYLGKTDKVDEMRQETWKSQENDNWESEYEKLKRRPPKPSRTPKPNVDTTTQKNKRTSQKKQDINVSVEGDINLNVNYPQEEPE